VEVEGKTSTARLNAKCMRPRPPSDRAGTRRAGVEVERRLDAEVSQETCVHTRPVPPDEYPSGGHG
jgi:hypothetical protein